MTVPTTAACDVVVIKNGLHTLSSLTVFLASTREAAYSLNEWRGEDRTTMYDGQVAPAVDQQHT